ncbi:hypothetical protein YC2023_001982 [Brassica napus]
MHHDNNTNGIGCRLPLHTMITPPMVVNFLCLNVASSCGLMVLKKPPPNPILPYKTTNKKRKEKYVCLVVFQMWNKCWDGTKGKQIPCYTYEIQNIKKTQSITNTTSTTPTNTTSTAQINITSITSTKYEDDRNEDHSRGTKARCGARKFFNHTGQKKQIGFDIKVLQMSGFGNTVTHTFCQNINKKVTPNQGNIKIAQTHKKTVGMRYRPKSIIYTVKCKPTLAFEEDKEERRWNLTETEENDDVLRDRCKWIRRFLTKAVTCRGTRTTVMNFRKKGFAQKMRDEPSSSVILILIFFFSSVNFRCACFKSLLGRGYTLQGNITYSDQNPDQIN